MVKEYGGYLPLELSKGRPYYTGDDVIALNAGRYAITYAIEDAGWKKIYLPYWLCDTVKDAIHVCLPKIEIGYYHIDEKLLPMDVTLYDQEGILWVNYFGLQQEAVIDRLICQYNGQIIIDNTQSFFTEPHPHAWQVYSCRKFFGVSDGSYVIHHGISHQEIPGRCSSIYSIHLLHSLERGTNYSYSLNKENETRLGLCGPASMSPLTSGILSSVDYEQVQESRRRNLSVLHGLLAPYNAFPVFRAAPAMSYPFLWKDSRLKKDLIQSKIYVPTLWQETLENPASSPWERYLSEHLCILPIDQRYDISDMEHIGNTVLQLIRDTSSMNEKEGYLLYET